MFDENGKRIRYDKNGNQITTVIGTFSVANRKNLINKKKNAMSVNSDGTGATDSKIKDGDTTVDADGQPTKKGRHRVTFAD